MALQAVVDTLDDVPESLRDHYEENGDGFRLKVEGLDDAAELKTALAKERESRKKAERLAKKFRDVDLDDVEAMRERLAALEDEQATKSGDWEKAREQLTSRHQKEQAKLTERLEFIESRLHRTLKSEAAIKAIDELGGISKALQSHVERNIELVEEDGDIKVVARGLDGSEVEGIGALVQQMKDSGDYDWGFKPNGATGGGSSGRRAGGAIGSVTSRAKLSVAEKAAYIREHGEEAYLSLPE